MSNYFSRRWRGQLPISVLLLRDTLAVGSLINVFASVLAMVAISQGLHAGVAVAIHLAPTPYNFFLFAAVGRHRDASTLYTLVAFAWCVLMMVV